MSTVASAPATAAVARRAVIPAQQQDVHAPFSVVLYRIIGNDLPPRHQYGQVYTNVKFILENEMDLPGWSKRWVLNRIVNMTEYGKVRRARRRVMGLGGACCCQTGLFGPRLDGEAENRPRPPPFSLR